MGFSCGCLCKCVGSYAALVKPFRGLDIECCVRHSRQKMDWVLRSNCSAVSICSRRVAASVVAIKIIVFYMYLYISQGKVIEGCVLNFLPSHWME